MIKLGNLEVRMSFFSGFFRQFRRMTHLNSELDEDFDWVSSDELNKNLASKTVIQMMIGGGEKHLSLLVRE